MIGKEFGGVYIGPELIALAKGNLQFNRIGMMTLSGKHCEGVVEDIAATLDALIEPICTMLFFVDWNGISLTAAVVDCIDKRYIELVWVLDEMVGTGHAYAVVRPDVMIMYTLCFLPAAPAPTTNTFFRSFDAFSILVESLNGAELDRSSNGESDGLLMSRWSPTQRGSSGERSNYFSRQGYLGRCT